MKPGEIVWKTLQSFVRQVWGPVDAEDPPDHHAHWVMVDGVPDLCCDRHR